MRVQGLGFGVKGSGFRVSGLWSRRSEVVMSPSSAPERRRKNSKGFTGKPRPAYGLDCLRCAKFVRQRPPRAAMNDFKGFERLFVS